MTVNTTSIVAGPYTGNGVTDTFDYTWKIWKSTQLIVYQTDPTGTEIVLLEGTHYSVTGIGAASGGTVVLTNPLINNYVLRITSNFALTQETDFVNQGAFYPQVHEDALDKLTYLVQQLSEVGLGSGGGGSTYPLPTPTPGYLLGWDSTGSNLVNYLPSVDSSLPAAVAGYYIGWDALGQSLQNYDPTPAHPLPAQFAGGIIGWDSFGAQLQNYTPAEIVTAGGGGGGGTGPAIYDTVAAMKLATPTAGDLVYTKGYYAAGDGGHAAYLVTTLASFGATPDASGDHSLANTNVAVLQTQGAINVLTFGLKGDGTTDNSVAFQNLINHIMTAGGGEARFAPGDFVFTSRVSTTVDLGLGASHGLSITGAGRGTTVVRVKNSNGFFKWTNSTSKHINLNLRDFSVVYDNTGSAGVIFEVYSEPGGNQHRRALTATNIAGTPVDAAVDYVDSFFLCTGVWRPLFDNCTSSGPFASGLPESTQTLGTAVFDVPECYDPTFRNCYAWGCTYGYRSVVTSASDAEAFTMTDCIANQTDIGVYRETPGTEPYLKINNCHINANVAGVRLNKVKLGFITGCLFYSELTSAYTDVDLIDCDDITLAKNTYHFTTNNANRKMVAVDSNCTEIFIDEEKFRGNGTAIYLAAGCDDITINKPWWNTQVYTPIDDQGATNLVVNHRKRWRCTVQLNYPVNILNSTLTTVSWSAANVEEGEWWDLGDPQAVRVPSNLGIRKVRVTANTEWGSNSTGRRDMRIFKGVTGVVGGGSVSIQAKDTAALNASSAVLDVIDNQALRLAVAQTSGYTLALQTTNSSTWMTVEAVDG